MGEAIKPFWKSIRDHWIILMTGGFFAAVLALLGLLNLLGVSTGIEIGIQTAFWASGLVFVVTITVAVFRAGFEQYRERLRLAERLRPKIEIRGVASRPPTDDHHRILVHNNTGRRIKFRAKLRETKPPLKYPLPVALQPTHCQGVETLGETGPDDNHPVDVFLDAPIQHLPPLGGELTPEEAADTGPHTRLILMGNPTYLQEIPRDERIELLIGVYPVSEEGDSEERWFFIVPQHDGSVIFTADGSIKGGSKPEP